MLIFYDTTGKIVTSETDKTTIQGNLSYMDITVPQGKELVKISTDVLPHIPVMRDKPKTATELTAEQIQMAIPQLMQMDFTHNVTIKSMADKITALEFRIGQLEAKGGTM